MASGDVQNASSIPAPTYPTYPVHSCSLLFLVACREVKGAVVTLLQGLIVLEPQPNLFHRYNPRAMNSIHEVVSDAQFYIFLSNFFALDLRLPKNTLVASAARSPITPRNLFAPGE